MKKSIKVITIVSMYLLTFNLFYLHSTNMAWKRLRPSLRRFSLASFLPQKRYSHSRVPFFKSSLHKRPHGLRYSSSRASYYDPRIYEKRQALRRVMSEKVALHLNIPSTVIDKAFSTTKYLKEVEQSFKDAIAFLFEVDDIDVSSWFFSNKSYFKKSFEKILEDPFLNIIVRSEDKEAFLKAYINLEKKLYPEDFDMAYSLYASINAQNFWRWEKEAIQDIVQGTGASDYQQEVIAEKVGFVRDLMIAIDEAPFVKYKKQAMDLLNSIFSKAEKLKFIASFERQNLLDDTYDQKLIEDANHIERVENENSEEFDTVR